MLALLLVVIFATGFVVLWFYRTNFPRTALIRAWLRDPFSNPEWMVAVGERCDDATFIIPTDGFIGYLWGDSFRAGHRHQGIDIFGGKGVNAVPVLAAYPGFLSRLPDWKSTVIIRIPDDPLNPGSQIWTYYTHMADQDGESFIVKDFPPGVSEVFVEQGTLLGYQGNYSGMPDNPVGVHLHFSIVKDDGKGNFLNELEFGNTIDPSPYLGLPLNARKNQGEVPACRSGSGP